MQPSTCRGTVKTLKRQPRLRAGSSRRIEQTPLRDIDSGAPGKLEIHCLAQPLFMPKRQLSRCELDQVRTHTLYRRGTAQITIIVGQIQLRLGTRPAGASCPDKLGKQLSGLAIEQGLSVQTKLGEAACVLVDRRAQSGDRAILQCPCAPFSNKSKPVHSRNLIGQNACLAKNPIHQHQPPPIGQGIGKHTMQSPMRRSRSAL